jgi:hypothetical protein
MICPNMRAAQIYIREVTGVLVNRLARALLAEPRIDLVMWHGRLAGSDADTYVAESPLGRLEFWRGTTGSQHARDALGTEWSWKGEIVALRLDVDNHLVESAEYPNAFERIAGALDARDSGEVWVTAQPGCEFELPGGEAHAGGASHGALHALDSLSLLVVGGAASPTLPRVTRSVDIAPICMQLLGVPMRYRVGDARLRPTRPDPASSTAAS